ncbi:hypothetical protein YG5714_2048 [Sulfolobus islandicus Y.G.57.14]|uniref:Uncharacterized protein n=1 Tax=Saccharolobus islandicus (strain Y.G.57.14 / Yellowstone \|nr:hypothetical protein [Sulfolobus islandicus]ACP46302.1 hypothetical protein YG5714_2048 [Sulfolobus islandicus Y.G.57.14]
MKDTDLSMLLSIIRLTELKESKRNALLSLIVQLSFAYFIALVIVSRFVGYVNYITYNNLVEFIIILSLILLIIITDILIKKYVSYTLINTLLETLNLKINSDNNFRRDIINASKNLNDKNKLYDLINKLFEKDNIEIKQLGLFIVSSVINYFAYIILLSIGFVLLNEVYTNLFSYRYTMISIFTLIVSYMLFIRNKIISSEEEEQIKYEKVATSYISLLINLMLNTKFTKNISTIDKIIYYLFTYIGVPLGMYTVVNSLFSVDSNNYPQKTPNVNLIYITDHEVSDKCCVKESEKDKIKLSEKDKIKLEEMRKNCEENIGSFLSYMAGKVGAKSVINMNKKEFTEFVCDLVKIFKKEENNKLFTLLCNKDSSLIAPYDLGNIKIYKGYLYVEESYNIERVLRNTEILNNSIILLTRVGKSISVTSLIRLRVKLSIEDIILLRNKIVNKGNKTTYYFKENLVNYKCDLDLAIFISQ